MQLLFMGISLSLQLNSNNICFAGLFLEKAETIWGAVLLHGYDLEALASLSRAKCLLHLQKQASIQ